MNESRRLIVDHLRAWVRHCEEQGGETVVGETMSSTHCLGASTLQHIYHAKEVLMYSFNEYVEADGERVSVEEHASSILDVFDRCQGENKLAPVTVAMLRETSVWGMLFPEEERTS